MLSSARQAYDKEADLLPLNLLAAALLGGASLTCDDISAIPELPRIDYATEIQPIFDGRCTFCHGFSGGLSLEEDVSYEELFCQLTEGREPTPAETRVVPFQAEESWLYLRIACDGSGGFRMPRGGVLSTTDIALVRDWINQGARPSAEDLFRGGFEDNETCAVSD